MEQNRARHSKHHLSCSEFILQYVISNVFER